MVKRLYKSNHDIKVDGVCGGLAEFLNIDPTIIRLIWFFVAFTGGGVLAYLVCCVVIPRAPVYPGEPKAEEADYVDYRSNNNQG